MNKVYSIITEKIVEALDKGVVPWQPSFKRKSVPMPLRYDANKPYRGANVFLLWAESMIRGYESPYWMTWNQIKKAGGRLKADEGKKAAIVIFYKTYTKADESAAEGEEKDDKRFVLRFYRVYNWEQTEGVKPKGVDALPKEQPTEFERIEAAEAIAARFPQPAPEIRRSQKAAYDPRNDVVLMPAAEQFVSNDRYYGTLYHELVHASGHGTRLDRELNTNMLSESYSFEELVAEIGAAFLGSRAGLEVNVEQSAAYIESWKRQLKKDDRLIIRAASAAQRAADWIAGEVGHGSEDENNVEAATGQLAVLAV